MALRNIVLLFSLFINAIQLIGQTTGELRIFDKNETSILSVKNGEIIRVVALDSFKMAHKYKGPLTVLNDSIIQINSNTIHIRQIFKVGKITLTQSRKGRVLLALGFACYGAGVGLIASGYNANTTISGRNQGALGSAGIILGTFFCTIGAKAIHGSPYIISSDRRIVLSISSI